MVLLICLARLNYIFLFLKPLSEIREVSAITLFDAGDGVEEVAEGELDQLDAASLGLVAPHEGRMGRP